MKKINGISFGLLGVFALFISVLAIRLSAAPSLKITAPNPAANGSITVNDPSNSFWVIQTSPDAIAWSNFTSWKVFNGSYQTNFSYVPASGATFFRAIYDPSLQTNLDLLANALLLPATNFNYANPSVPANYHTPGPILGSDNMPSTNQVTDAGATLGRALFYDKRLSANQTVSCSTCHVQAKGFADTNAIAIGINGGRGTRNAMALNDARYFANRTFFWDTRAATLEAQVLQPISNPVELGNTLTNVVARLSAEPFYTNLFFNAYGSNTVTTNGIKLALAQFVRSIVSTNSKYDIGLQTGFTNFTAQETLGRQLFSGQSGSKIRCASCHANDTFSLSNTFNNGLEYPYVDLGVGGVTGRSSDMGIFKAPSLRNIALTAPYMHDGRFSNLTQVVQFYSSNIVANPNLGAELATPPTNGVSGAIRANFTDAQVSAIVAFLNTLTDTTLTTDPKFSDPFNYGK